MFNFVYLSPLSPIRACLVGHVHSIYGFLRLKKVCFLIGGHVKEFIHPGIKHLSSFNQACILWNTKADV